MIIERMTTLTAPSSPLECLHGAARLDHLGVIQVEGEEAAKFIHGQLTHDFSLLDQSQARLAAFCTAKGRMQASMLGFKRPSGELLLVLPLDLLAPTLKRLSMFVMRAKARLSDASALYMLRGLAGSAINSEAAGAGSIWAKTDIGTQTWVNLYPAEGVARQLWLAPVGTAEPRGSLLDSELWHWGEVRSGVALVSQAIAEAFVPQMLNYESVDGVSFKKGCYPGQEVVARSQFRGTLKRRAMVVHCAGELSAGQELFAPDDASQPVAVVAQGARHPAGGFDAVVSVQLSALNGPVQTAQGAALQFLPLPYPLRDDI
jgi:tRNA-modifying protein YgfZ